MPSQIKLGGYLSLAVLALTLSSSPVAAECVIGSAPLFYFIRLRPIRIRGRSFTRRAGLFSRLPWRGFGANAK